MANLANQINLKKNVLTKDNTTSFTPNWDYQPATKKYVDDWLSWKQATLVSWTNIKTINNESILWSWNITIQWWWSNYNAWDWIGIMTWASTKWPCADWFHVPTSAELISLHTIWTALWWATNWWTAFWQAYKIPFNGNLTASWWTSNRWSYWFLWSCTWSADKAYTLRFNASTITNSYLYDRSLWFCIRPFKDTPVTPTSSWTKLYWTSIEAWGIFWNSTDWLISASWDWSTWVTISDKDAWATSVWNSWDTLSDANCGKYYQWWNNYGFSYASQTTTSTTKVDTSWYWPWNYYSSSTYIKTTSDWSSVANHNLWWWETWFVIYDNAIVDNWMNSKLDRISWAASLARVYAVDTAWWQVMINVSQWNSSNAIVRRSWTWIIVPDTPWANTHAVNVNYINSNLLTKTNTTEYTPTANYHPATKKYVDDLVWDVETLLAAI